MADHGFRIVLIASAVVLVLAAIDVIWLIRTRHSQDPADRARSHPESQAEEFTLDPLVSPAAKPMTPVGEAGRS